MLGHVIHAIDWTYMCGQCHNMHSMCTFFKKSFVIIIVFFLSHCKRCRLLRRLHRLYFKSYCLPGNQMHSLGDSFFIVYHETDYNDQVLYKTIGEL